MNYKVQILNGYKLYFNEITNVFNTRYSMGEKITIDKLTDQTGLNRRKTRLLLNFLSDLGLSKKRTLKKTRLGLIINEYDSFLEDEGTIWLLHYLAASNKYFVIWNRFFNYIYQKKEFELDEILNLFTDLKGEISDYSYNHHIRKEVVSILIDAYIKRRFKKLNLISKLDINDNNFLINSQSSVPELIFLAACIKFRNNFFEGATSLEIKDIYMHNSSPGRMFLLNNKKTDLILENLKRKRRIGIESQANLNQIRFSNDINFEEIVREYYEQI